MSFLDLYMGGGPLITSQGHEGSPSATVFGIPFDSTHSYRPGTRFGPDAIRSAFNNIEVFHEDLGVDLEEANIEDLGNLIHTVSPQEMLDMAGKVTAELIKSRRQLIILGGEHLITYGTYTQFPTETGYVVFDAHYDLRDGLAGARLSHASYLRRIVEERGGDKVIHVGARAFVGEELAFLKENGIRTITDGEIRSGRGPELLKEMASTFDTIYASFDLDVLDPAFAPGVGNPEAAGITSRELLDMISALRDARISGADIVEASPQYDNGATAAVAARIMSDIIAMNLQA